jgi:hypothetical protein
MKEEKIEKKLARIGDLLLPDEGDVTYLGSHNASVPDRKGKSRIVTGDLYLTNQRLIHFGKVVGSKSLTTIELKHIINLSIDARPMVAWLDVSTANTNARFQIAKQEAANLLTLVQSRKLLIESRVSVQGSESDPLANIKKLGALLEEGLITQSEFDQKKIELLNQI